MARFARPVLAPLLLLAAAQAALAAPTASATLLARSTLLGVQSAMREAQQGGTVSVDAATCVRSLQPTALVPVFETAVSDNWSRGEVDAIERFLATPAGRKYAERSVAQARLDAGERVADPLPSYTDEEIGEVDRFKKTAGGAQLMGRSEFANPKSREAIQGRLLELLKGCGAVKR